MSSTTTLDAYRAFQAIHAPHGPLLVSADEPTERGHGVWAVCVCGAKWRRRWITLAAVLAEADTGQATARIAAG